MRIFSRSHRNKATGPKLGLRTRFSLFLSVAAVVALLSAVKFGIHWLDFEFITLNALLTSGIGGAIFIIGFLLSSVLSDFKESERLPTEIRVALEAIYGDVSSFAAANSGTDLATCRSTLKEIVLLIREGLSREGRYSNLRPVLKSIDKFTEIFVGLEKLGCPANYIVRLRTSQDSLRRSIFRIYYIQRVQFVPSVHVLVQTLVSAIIFLMLFLKTEGSPESTLMFGFISFLFVYALYLINQLEQPFQKGRATFDDVSLFLLEEFVDKLENQRPASDS